MDARRTYSCALLCFAYSGYRRVCMYVRIYLEKYVKKMYILIPTPHMHTAHAAQQRLGDTMRTLVGDECAELRHEYYDAHALVGAEDAVVVAGLLVGANVIECRFAVREHLLDALPPVIDLSLFLKVCPRP